FVWADAFRGNRVKEVLESGRKFSLQDMAALQNDALAIPARILVPLLKDLEPGNKKVEKAVALLQNWNYKLEKSSVAAGIYVMWERKLDQNMLELMVPEEARPIINRLPITRTVEWLVVPPPAFGTDPI